MLENGLELPYTDPLASASPFIDDKTKLLKSRGRIGYNMKSQGNIEFLQEYSEHYNIILPSRGSFVKSYLLEIHQKYNCASERFISIVRQERFFMTSPVRIGKSAISRCFRCVKRRALVLNYQLLLGTCLPTEYLVERTPTIIVPGIASCLI